MLTRMKENIDRQNKGIQLLSSLLEEEFSLLKKGKSQEVSRIELSIQELMRQLMQERLYLKKMVRTANKSARKMSDLFEVMPPKAAAYFRKVLQQIDNLEQHCARRAEKNRALAMGLHEQSSSLLQFIHEKIQPKQDNVYSRRGRYAYRAPQAALLSGRF